MTRDDAVQRVNEGLGFRSYSDIIVRRLVEAQRDLENGNSLPHFLVHEDADLVLLEGTKESPLPRGFIREYDDGCTWTMKFRSSMMVPIRRVDLNSLLILDPPTSAGPPAYYVIRAQSIYFGRFANQTYTLAYSYYRREPSLATAATNAWLELDGEDSPGAGWLLGLAGGRLAQNLRDKEAERHFAEMMTLGHESLFKSVVLREDMPLALGSGL